MRLLRLSPLVLVFVFGLVLVACGKEAAHLTRRQASGDTTFSLADHDFFHALNQANSDTQEAIHIALPTTADAVRPSELTKAQQMAEKISGVCNADMWTRPAHDFHADWSSEEIVTGSERCPIYLRQTQAFLLATKTWAFTAKFENRSDAFRVLSPIGAYAMSGVVRVEPPAKNATTIQISGYADMQPLTVTDVGNLKVHIEIHHLVSGAGVTSSIMAAVTFPNGRRQVVSVGGRNSQADKSYFVDNIRYTRKEFEELFSFLGLDEIMDKSKDMR